MTLWEQLSRGVIARRDIVLSCVVLAAAASIYVAPFEWRSEIRDPLSVDAIPDLGDNQQVVVTEWPGRSPQDVDDQVTYPLSAALMGVAGVDTVRGSSMFGLSTVYVIFEDGTDFYWARSRVVERLASLTRGTLPPDVAPTLGPDATGVGQVFWYTLEGRDPNGNTVGGFDLDELRSIQDWTVRFALQAVDGVSEVASVGGFVREYQVDVDPDALRAREVDLDDVVRAVRQSNLQVGARTLEINQVEYVVRGLGLVESVAELEDSVVALKDGVPVRVRDIARVALGPALRRGALDDGGAPAVGGVVVARVGANPREVIRGVRRKIEEISPGLPSRTLDGGVVSEVRIVPFYDRTELID
ncbi:MAG: efflux RND transporter permease subunit, partial [Myxococcota bacterium]